MILFSVYLTSPELINNDKVYGHNSYSVHKLVANVNVHKGGNIRIPLTLKMLPFVYYVFSIKLIKD